MSLIKKLFEGGIKLAANNAASTTQGELRVNSSGDLIYRGASGEVTLSDTPQDAGELSYDNSTSGLTATDVQAAIDEVEGRLDPDAADVPYDNTGTEVTSANVQDAITEVADLAFFNDLKVIHVNSSEGNNTNSGSSLAPVETLAEAVSRVTDSNLNYLIKLASGTYASVSAIQWPFNASLEGAGLSTDITADIEYTAATSSVATFTFSKVKAKVTLDLALATQASLTFRDGEYEITRIDSLPPTGPWFVTVRDSNLWGKQLGSVFIINNCVLIGSECLVKTDANVIMANTTAGIPIEIEEDGSLNLKACTVVNTITGVDVNPGLIQTDASSISQAPSITNCTVTYVDKAEFIDYDNTSSGLTAETAQAAIDEIEARLDTAESDITGKQDDVITTAGDIIIGNGSGEASRLAVGTNGQVLRVVSGAPAWDSAAGAAAADTSYSNATSGLTATNVQDAIDEVEGRLDIAESDITGKQDDVITTRGDIIVGNSSNVAARIALGSSGQVLTSDGTDAAWATPRIPAHSVESFSTTGTIAATTTLALCDATSGAFTLTLPSYSGALTGKQITIKKTDSTANAITVDGSGAETINGATTYSLAVQNDQVELVFNGTEWKIITNNRRRISLVQDVKTTTNVASVTGGVVTRTLNTLQDSGSIGLALDGSGVNIPAGTYRLSAKSVFYRCNHTKLYFYNVTDAVYINLNASQYYAATTNTAISDAFETIIVTFTSTKKIELRQWTETAVSNGLSGDVSARTGDPGTAANSVVAQIEIEKLT